MNNMTMPQLFAAVAGSFCCLVSLYVLAIKKTMRFKALFWLAVGVTAVYAAFRPNIIELLGPDSGGLRLRLVVALMCFAVLTLTLEAVRIGRMQERYAFLWIVTGILLFGGAMLPKVASVVADLTGIQYGVSLIVLLFSFVLFTLFYVSVELSRLQVQLAKVVRMLALTEERLRQVECAADHSTGTQQTKDV
jgi:hypothetical protein